MRLTTLCPHGSASSEQAQQIPLEDRVAVEERRTAEQAQTKVEAAHKFPIQLDGMLLFNAFANSTTPTPGSEYASVDRPQHIGRHFEANSSGREFSRTEFAR